MTAWEDFPEWEKISDEDIKEIILWRKENGDTQGLKNSESSDAARKAILRIYSYETPLYSALNNASQCQDQRAIKTLGPFACLLVYTLAFPPEDIVKVMEAQLQGAKNDRITLYRGLGLPKNAIKGYYHYLSS